LANGDDRDAPRGGDGDANSTASYELVVLSTRSRRQLGGGEGEPSPPLLTIASIAPALSATEEDAIVPVVTTLAAEIGFAAKAAAKAASTDVSSW